MLFTNLIWDFDGTLFDTYPRMASAFHQALHKLGVEESMDRVMLRIKRSVSGAAEVYAKEQGLSREAIMDAYHQIEHALPTGDMQPYDGMDCLIRDAWLKGCRHFLYTHRNSGSLEALRLHGMLDCFSGFITKEDPFPLKPAPDAILSILHRFDLNPDECLMLGDRDIDVEAGHNAGIAGCLYDPEHFYDSYATRYRVNSVKELRAFLEID